MKQSLKNIAFGIFIIVTCYTITLRKTIPIFKSKHSSNRITLMTYNVENLFDTEDDPNKKDETYLPTKYKNKNSKIQKKCDQLKAKLWRHECKNLNWDHRTLNSKMNRLADVILNSNKGIGPDILILQEVENLKVLETLRGLYLRKHYSQPAILIEGPDERGIDVAILSKLKLRHKPKIHTLSFTEEYGFSKKQFPTTRPILESTFLLSDQTTLTIFGAHFPSQGTPTAARKQALNQLIKLMKNKPENNLVIAAGDLNITSYEENKYKYFKSLHDHFLVSHLVGCSECKGTNYYRPRNSWSFLDVMLFSKNLDSNSSRWNLEKSSIRVFKQSLYQNNNWGQPKKFEAGKSQQGVSDHWPLLADIVLNSSRSKGTFK